MPGKMGSRARKLSVGAVTRYVRANAERAIEALSERPAPSDAAVHAARKRIKKVRAGLRVLREVLGAKRYRRENADARDAARPLSAARDSRVLLEQLSSVARAIPAAERAAIAPVRAALLRDQARARARVPRDARRAVARLRAAHRRAARWPKRGGWRALRQGVRRVYRDARAAFTAASASPTDAALHEWRKEVKYLWHALEIVEPLRPAHIAPLAREANALADLLGEDHDLAMLRRRIVRSARGAPLRSRAWIQRVIDARRGRLEARALARGRALFRDPPKGFVARLEG